MKIKITPAFTKADVQKDVDAFMERVFKITLNEIRAVGEKFVKDARQKAPADIGPGGSFNDQTGNLRSSIGYIIVYDGNIVREDFQLSKRGTERTPGMIAGREFAEYQAALNPTGWALITVAGMEYAAFVEAKGYDVITGSTLTANSDMNKVWANVKRAFQ